MAIESECKCFLSNTGANDEIEDSDDTENSGAGMSDEEERAEGEPLISDTNRYNQPSTLDVQVCTFQ